MEEKIKDRLNRINPSTQNIDELYEIFNSVKDKELPMIVVYLDAGASIIRQRLNKDGQYLKTVSSLSYNPVSKNYGRANIPGHPMFYGCAFPMDSEAPEPRLIALMETSEFAMNENTIGVERATCGRWDVIEKMDLLAFPFFENYDQPIKDITKIQEDWEKAIKNVKIDKEAVDIVEYMSYEISKKAIKEEDYFIIANYVYFLLYLNESTKNYDGVIFPSVPAEGFGFNVALKPEAVDKKLKFGASLLQYLVKEKKKVRVDNIKHSVKVSKDGMITYKEEDDYNENKYKKLNFVN